MDHWIVWKVDDEKSPSGVQGTAVSADSAGEAFEIYARDVLGSKRHDGQRLRAVCIRDAIEVVIQVKTSIRLAVKS